MLKIISHLIPILLINAVLFTQSEDSLLKQISEIEVSLDSPIESEENLYLNTVSFQSFYDLLSPMGEWIQITKEEIDEDLNEGEGQSFSSFYNDDDELLFIWKPKVNEDWKPYLNGRWEYTEHGWLWVSDDAWGNSTYHYGRWWRSPKYGWVWLPGYTWAPAWVRWRISNDFVGWVALTPKAKWKIEDGITETNYRFKDNDADWVFVEKQSFVNEINKTNIVNSEKNASLIKNSNSVTHIKAENDAIVNKGPDAGDIEKRTGKKLYRKKLRFRKGHGNALIGEGDITLNRESFKKYDASNNRKIIDKPKKFKRSEKVKKILKKRKIQKRKGYRK